MHESNQKGEIFFAGTPLTPNHPEYIWRPADSVLYEALASGDNAHIFSPAGTGKTSLIANTATRLQKNGCNVAIIGMDQILERRGDQDIGRFYYAYAYRIIRQLRLRVDLQSWWQSNSVLSNHHRLMEFYREVILQNTSDPVVILIDDIQLANDAEFAAQLLSSIGAAHNARTTEPEFARITFALISESRPYGQLADSHMSPFSISLKVPLHDYDRELLDIYVNELGLGDENAAIALDRVFHWTNGHPYLTQMLARFIARLSATPDIAASVDQIVMQSLTDPLALQSEPHISHIHRQLVADSKRKNDLLRIYGKLCKGATVKANTESRSQNHLLASGLVKLDDSGSLMVRNRIYEAVFTTQWANDHKNRWWR